VYLKYVLMSFRSQLQYRASFLMMTAGHFLVTVVEFFGIWALFSRFGSIKGWDLREIAVFYGIISICFAVSEGLGRGFDVFSDQVITGEFDRALLRPRTTFLQVLAHDFQLMRAGRMTQGVVVLVWGLADMAIAWSVPKAFLLAGSIAGGVMLFLGLMIIQATMTFWSTQSLEVMNSFTYGGVETAQWPISIYGGWFVKVFIFVIPLACVNYFPVMAILEKPDPLGSPAWLQWLSPVAGAAFFAVSLKVWDFGVRHYRSTGS
jgi:ABC-2 type transport system permease protein